MDFLNKRSPAYKERELETKKLTKKQVIALMMEDPNLMRRPLVMRGSKDGIFGYDEAGYDTIK